MHILFVLFTIVAGIFSALESGSNNTLHKTLDAPWWTIAIVSVVTLTASATVVVVSGERWPGSGLIAAVPWYGWLGGLFGFVFIISTVFASPKLGAGVFVAIVVTASTAMSLVLDNYGLMGFSTHAATIGRIAGALLMIAGVVLIALF